MLKRVISAIIGLLILILVLFANNMIVLNIAVTIIALIGISEFYNALRLAAEDGKISSSQLQRRLRLGFQRAARIIDQMYDLGFIGEPNGQKPRDVLITLEQYNEMMMRRKDNN